MIAVQPCGASATLSMIGFRQIGQLEINRKRFSELVGIFDGKAGDDSAGLRHADRRSLLCCLSGTGLAMLNEKTPEMLNHIQQRLAGLFHQHPAEQNSQRTNIAPERKFFGGVRSGGSQLGEARLWSSSPTMASRP